MAFPLLNLIWVVTLHFEFLERMFLKFNEGTESVPRDPRMSSTRIDSFKSVFKNLMQKLCKTKD